MPKEHVVFGVRSVSASGVRVHERLANLLVERGCRQPVLQVKECSDARDAKRPVHRTVRIGGVPS